jgi:hypothetical protein
MNKTPDPSFAKSLGKILSWLERGAVVVVIIGLILTATGTNASQILMISMSALAGVYFLYAYQPIQIEREEGEKYGFKELLAFTIAPKISWIGNSVMLIGILFSLLSLNGARQMLMVGIGAGAVASFILGALSASGTKNIESIQPVLLRTIPLLGVSLYLFLK